MYSFNFKNTFSTLGVLALTLSAIFISDISLAKKSGDNLSVEIRNRMYPKKKTIEIAGDFGAILNQSYISSMLAHASFTLFTSESIGFGADIGIAINSDKAERLCVENFYNDPGNDVSAVCAIDGEPDFSEADGSGPEPNMGPAYPPIRVLNNLISGYMVWSPVYGKQLLFMSGVVHFDIFITGGGGIAMNTYYPLKEQADDGTQYRGDYPDIEGGSTETIPGIDPDNTDEYGFNARPEPESQTTPMLTFGIGQKFHFGKNVNLRMEVRNYTLVGTESIFETYFAAWGGLGLRF